MAAYVLLADSVGLYSQNPSAELTNVSDAAHATI